MPRTATRLLTLVAALAVATMTAAGPAPARVVERGVIDETFTDAAEDFCDAPGLDVTFGVTVHVAFTWKTRGADQLAYYAEHGQFRNRITNVANGTYVDTYEKTLSKDMKIVDLGGGILDIVFMATGNFTVWNSAGKAISRNPGQVRFHTVVNIHDPADDEDDEELLFEQVKGSTGRTDDFCADVVPALR
jgi:hypothetical protein